jgi:plastocyanin
MKKLLWAAFTALILFTVVVAAQRWKLHAATASAPAGAEIKIDNFSFAPESLTVKAGTQVTWINRDDIPHTVVESERSFKSKVLDTDDKFTMTFDKPGTYSYFCSIHPKMTGKIVVQ